MHEFKKILFPVDLSEVSEKIVPYVRLMATKFDAEIHLLFVAHVLEEFTSIYVPHPSVKKFESEIVAGAERKIAEFTQEHFGDCKTCNVTVSLGDVTEEIITYIQSARIDLVVLGTHGRKGLDRIIFGSIADQVVKLSPVPVLSINPYRKIE